MKAFYYIHYFFYIGRNWNYRLALFSIYHEIRGEIKYRINTSRLNDLQELTLEGDTLEDAKIYQGSSYFLLEDVFGELRKLKPAGEFVDMGCGKGRVLVVAAHYGFRKITGVDFAGELCVEARNNCRKIKKKFPSISCQVIHENAAFFRVEKTVGIIYFFNPFSEIVMKEVIINILKSVNEFSRTIFVVYVNPQQKKLFLQAGFKEIYFIRKMEFVEACILKLVG